MQPSTDRVDAVVIGGGLAGLTGAAFIARQGLAVRLIEQSHALGGRARTKEVNGFQLNLGAHALYRGGRGIEVLRELGVEPKGAMPSPSRGFAVRGRKKYTFPAGVVSLLTTGLFGLAAKLETARILGSIPKLDGDAVMDISLSEWLDSKVSQPEVRDLLLAAFRVATYTNAPDLMSAGAAIEQLKKAFVKNVLYLDGGWQTLVDGVAAAARDAGVVIETSAKPALVERDPRGSVRAVSMEDGRRLETSSVLIATPPAVAAALVERSQNTNLGRWAQEAIPIKLAALDVALDSLPEPKATFALGLDQPLYFSVHSAAARLAPEGKALIHLGKYLPPDDSNAARDAEQELEALLDLMQPGWRKVVAYRRFAPDLAVMNGMPAVAWEGTARRPGPAVPDIDGLFVAGDWVGAEGMLVDASLASARRAADLIAARQQVRLAAAV